MNDPDPPFLLRAISFARRSHLGQMRKDGETPYFAHPVRVMTILLTEFGVTDPEVEKAKKLITLFEPMMPKAWRHALEKVRQRIEAAERSDAE